LLIGSKTLSLEKLFEEIKMGLKEIFFWEIVQKVLKSGKSELSNMVL
jgi:hypothetical protein